MGYYLQLENLECMKIVHRIFGRRMLSISQQKKYIFFFSVCWYLICDLKHGLHSNNPSLPGRLRLLQYKTIVLYYMHTLYACHHVIVRLRITFSFCSRYLSWALKATQRRVRKQLLKFPSRVLINSLYFQDFLISNTISYHFTWKQ